MALSSVGEVERWGELLPTGIQWPEQGDGRLPPLWAVIIPVRHRLGGQLAGWGVGLATAALLSNVVEI